MMNPTALSIACAPPGCRPIARSLRRLSSSFDPLTILRKHRFQRRIIRASNSEPRAVNPSPPPQRKSKSSLKALLDFPRSMWNQISHPLSNFGFGKKSLWEAGLGLFLLGGIVLLGLTLAWVKGTQLRARSRKYFATFEFAKAWGITVGTPVRIRGVDVGTVIRVKPTLEKLDVEVQIVDANLVIPRNALVEVNQSGLVSETLIDITPQHPIPSPTVGPLHPDCKGEGLIVCDRESIRGEQGVSLDELVGICTKLAKQIDAQGVKRLYDVGERMSLAVEEAKPLLAKVQSMAGDMEPLIKEIRDGGLLKEFEKLTKVAAEAGEDLRKLNSSVLTPENTELLRQSVSTLTKTLKHIESISEDISGLTGDAGTRYNLKQLIQSLSRLVAD
ncbi:protein TRIGALACTOSYLDIACYLGLYCEROL 2, chloroplastic [Selaginella moellendorffii]|uniref:protein TRIGALACTOSYLDIACYLGLYCEROL 2, chloroplastic n=1 Tax=Selaginella moellendorffii TaxID=88036 RepID=UPI000D1CFE4B|nr:protein TRIGALACTOSYLDIACYLGLYCEROL 2, chloroplastic [Selaginella moellendorffii]|eukprot:XP_002964383.2 protein TRIGALACTOSYLDIACYLGLYCEROL 2, chloroplastic [Selaginella moellendorffii]